MPEAFLVIEKEHPISFNWPAQRAAKLVSLERRGADRLIEKVPGIQLVIAQKLKDRAMQLVGARLRDHADLRAGALAVFGRISIADHIEFPDGVNAQQLSANAARSDTDVAAARVFDTIQEENVVIRPPPSHSEIGASPEPTDGPDFNAE